MNEPVRISCVSYLNSLPFVHGLNHHPVRDRISLQLDHPSTCAFKLREGIVDIGLIPVAAIEQIPNAHPVSNWCIGATGPVKSVTLLSEVPLAEIQDVLLDFQSVTSNRLVQVLCSRYWNIQPRFLGTQPGFEHHISGTTAGVVIGDRSLEHQHRFEFVYDLAQEWQRFTGLPFVFARWVANQQPDPDFLSQFDEALALGVARIDRVIEELKAAGTYTAGADDYLKNNLSYPFDDRKRQGMELFLSYSAEFAGQGIRAWR